MKKFLKALIYVLLTVILLILLYVFFTFPPVMSGMAAKTMCSCVYVTGRTPQSVRDKELQVFPGLADARIELNDRDSTVTGSVLWKTSKAIFRKGLGCTLLAEAEEAIIRKQNFITRLDPPVDQDTIPWPSGNLEAQSNAGDINTIALDKIVQQAFVESDRENPANTHAIVVVYDGKIISEQYAEGFGFNSILMGWSMTKSITNALIGVLVKDGQLQVDQAPLVEEWQNDERKNITLNNLLQASSGLDWSESYFNPASDFHNMFIRSDDKAGYAARQRLKHEPGSYFQYSGGTTNILSRIIRRTVGDRMYHRFPYEKLFYKIGMNHTILEPDASGTFVGSSYGYASARDWARLGLLYLNNGVWNGERVFPEGWVQYSITPAPAATRGQYGAQIWLNQGEDGKRENAEYPALPADAFIFEGFETNFVVVIPSRDLIVVRLGVTHNQNFSLSKFVSDILRLIPEKNKDIIVTNNQVVQN